MSAPADFQGLSTRPIAQGKDMGIIFEIHFDKGISVNRILKPGFHTTRSIADTLRNMADEIENQARIELKKA